MALTADTAAVRRILETDRAWAVYALADLAPEYSAPARWHIAADGCPALLLVYRGFEPPVLFAHGAVADLNTPWRTLSACRVRTHADTGGYQIRDEKKMWRMVANPARFVARASTAVRLGPADYKALANLHRDGDAAGSSVLRCRHAAARDLLRDSGRRSAGGSSRYTRAGGT
jgi:hypothetical protein